MRYEDEENRETVIAIHLSHEELTNVEVDSTTREMILQMSQSPLLSTQLCALVELVSALEKAEALKVKVPTPEKFERYLQDPDNTFSQASFECRNRANHTGELTCVSLGYARKGCSGRLDCPDFEPLEGEPHA